MSSRHGGNRRRRFARTRKAYDEVHSNDQGRPRRHEPDVHDIDITYEPMDDTDWLGEERERRYDQAQD